MRDILLIKKYSDYRKPLKLLGKFKGGSFEEIFYQLKERVNNTVKRNVGGFFIIETTENYYWIIRFPNGLTKQFKYTQLITKSDIETYIELEELKKKHLESEGE